MFEEVGCVWCARWEKDVGASYDLAREARLAPLTKLDVNDRLPDEITLARAAHFTPTFVLLDEGREVSRIEGYPGEDFFWGLLQMMIQDAMIANPSNTHPQTTN